MSSSDEEDRIFGTALAKYYGWRGTKESQSDADRIIDEAHKWISHLNSNVKKYIKTVEEDMSSEHMYGPDTSNTITGNLTINNKEVITLPLDFGSLGGAETFIANYPSVTGPSHRWKDPDTVNRVKANYPEMTNEFLKIQMEQFETFCMKSASYGTDNIAMGTSLSKKEDVDLSLMSLWVRLNDKINRLKQLVMFKKEDVVGEPAIDAFQDLSVYGIIAQIVIRGKWAK